MELLKIKANNQIKQTIAAKIKLLKIKLLKIKLNNKMKRAIAANTGTKAATTLLSTRETILQTHHR